MGKRLRILVGGYIGLYPTGGATMDYIQYPLGLLGMGHDVYYVEDTMLYPVFQSEGDRWDDASHCVGYLSETMEQFGMADRWAYRDVASGKCFGMGMERLMEVCRTADLFINISCSTFMREEYMRIPARAMIDSDPMFTQLTCLEEMRGESPSSLCRMLDAHTHLFTFGENLGTGECRVPLLGRVWHPTRQPICLNLWRQPHTKPRHGFTSVMNWSGRAKMRHEGEEWGQKDVEFMKFTDLPSRFPGQGFEMVMNPPLNKESLYDEARIKASGWTVMKPSLTVGTPQDYIDFIRASSAEFSIAKETYVKSKSGWFSCRSACYLAAGRPVAAQDTGWPSHIPSGKGAIAFSDMEQAEEAVRTILADPRMHGREAEAIAAEYFDSGKVLRSLIESCAVKSPESKSTQEPIPAI
jgi:hypothetical protein